MSQRFIVLAIVAVMVVAALNVPQKAHITKEFVDSLNKREGMTWTASLDNGHVVNGATKEDLKKLMGVKRSKNSRRLPKKVFNEAGKVQGVPSSFDSATNWPNCPTIKHIRDQSACGSCWAVGAASAISDRYCIGGVASNLEISAANLMECCWYCGSGCEGGEPDSAWSYWVSTGLMMDACQPYPFPKCEHHIPVNHYPACPSTAYQTPSCTSNACTANATSSNTTLFKGTKSYALQGEANFQAEVFQNGPIEVTFNVYDDFLAYKSGVYQHTSGEYLGGHAVRLVGWGELNGVKYWKIANSWNSDWGLEGYFLILRGADECGIEDEGSAGLA